MIYVYISYTYTVHAGAGAAHQVAGAPPRQTVSNKYRGTSLMRNSAPLGPFSRTMPRTLWTP